MWLRLAGAIALAVVAASANAHDYTLSALRIGHPSARPTPPGARTGGAYFTIENTGSQDDRLVRVASPAAASVELHSMTMAGNVMKMRALKSLDIPAGRKVALGAGGYHVMLIDLKRPLAAGDQVPITLTFEKAGTIDVLAQVEAPSAASAPEHAH